MTTRRGEAALAGLSARRAVAYGRLPLQAPLIWWAPRVARTRP